MNGVRADESLSIQSSDTSFSLGAFIKKTAEESIALGKKLAVYEMNAWLAHNLPADIVVRVMAETRRYLDQLEGKDA